MASESDSSRIIRDYPRNYNQEHWSSFHTRKCFRTACFGVFEPAYDQVICLYKHGPKNTICKKAMKYMAANSYRLNGIKRKLWCNYHTDQEQSCDGTYYPKSMAFDHQNLVWHCESQLHGFHAVCEKCLKQNGNLDAAIEVNKHYYHKGR